MRHSMRYFAVLAVLVSLALSFWFGAIYGAALAGVQYDAKFSPSDAVETTMVLRLLRRGDVEEAIAQLESKVDSDLLTSEFYDPDFDRWVGNADADSKNLEARLKVLQLVQKYQDEFPYESRFDRMEDAMRESGADP